MSKSTPEPEITSPIPFRTGSNGEFMPRPLTEKDSRAEALFQRVVDEKSRRLGVSRRAFVESACGTAAALWVINVVYGCGGDESTPGSATGSTSGYDVDAGTTEDAGEACEKLSGDEFIFDVQTHQVNPDGAWRRNAPGWAGFFADLPQGSCGEADPVDCFDAKHYIEEMFLNSDTAIAVLSAVPAYPEDSNPLITSEARATLELVNQLASSERLVIHGMVVPNAGQSELDGMQKLAEEMGIAAWKVYTGFGGWRLDDDQIGIPFIEKARSLGVKTICIHKGLRLSGFDPAFSSPEDVGIVAAAYPDVKFLVYHSGWESDGVEGPYDAANPQGIDRLVKAVQDNAIGKDGNVYAELGSTWRGLMTSPDQAAHAIGKLLLHMGEDRILWGTDSIWYGTPQDQIAAFRAFQIPQTMQDQFGYPALTDAIKRKIFGLNAAAAYGIDPEAKLCAISKDALEKAKTARLDMPKRPLFRAYGPRTRREMIDFMRARGGVPG